MNTIKNEMRLELLMSDTLQPIVKVLKMGFVVKIFIEPTRFTDCQSFI
jgi:hypothetical protein